jgi:hypothetical protein
MRIRKTLLLAVWFTLPGFAQADDDRGRRHEHSAECDDRVRPVSLETGIRIDIAYCGAKADVTTTVGRQDPSSDGKFYTIVTHVLHRREEDSGSYVLIYKPNTDWAIPATTLDSMGALALQQGSLDDSDHSGWIKDKDSRLEQRGQDWLPARQIVMRKPSSKQWVYYRIIRDTRHNLIYVLYQRDDEGWAKQENRFFDSFAVDPGSVTVDITAGGPGAHLDQPYPNP